MTQFEWLSQSISPPARWDLRYLDWELRSASETESVGASNERLGQTVEKCPVLLDWRPASRPDDWRNLSDRRWTMVIGVDDSDDRALLIADGYGEVLPTNVALVELAARALRIGDTALAMKRYREAGPVTLDLFHRDGRIDKQWLGFHPREFALLWRLAETPGKRVTRRELLADVWRLDYEPATNSVEVHISRLRSKLAISHACWLVQTDPRGGYRLADGGRSSLFAPGEAHEQALDRSGRISDDMIEQTSGEQDAVVAKRARVRRSR